MSDKLLQLNFNFSISRAEYEQTATSLATEFAAVDGLRWKIWLMNEGGSEAGGIYLFDDESSLQAFLAGPLAAQVQSHPAFSNLSAKVFDVLDDPTAVTRGPVKTGASA